ncbi:MAG: gamma carbonic anhydrase family protein [Deltaproteobacteria bacterium]|nr:gamma carbonic anhydrase family protein [Deltaproteobacteria bacterium]
MLLDFKGMKPKIAASAFVADNALVIGDVELGAGANVFFYTLIRGDVNYIRIGTGCNIQDGCILHVASDRYPTILEEDVVLGHRVTAHGCHIERGALIGIGASVLNGARIGREAIVGAGAVVTPRSVIPPRTLALGTPARPVREITAQDLEMIRTTRESYRELTEIYRTTPLPR